MIPKANGKLRKLGIPTIADRVVQASLKLVLEPIFEADFKPCSYGFRPNRRAQDAISEIHLFASRPSNYQWVLECDIKACFDEISHTALMDRLRARIKDKRICALVKAFLKSGVLTELGDREDTLTGTPQGGILSPLLANIALSALDDHFDRQWHQDMGTSRQRAKRKAKGLGTWRLIRYADDFVLMVTGDRHHAEALREEVSAVLAPLGLRLAPEKTRVVHIDEGFTFLGFDIRRLRKRGTSKQYVYTTPSRKAIQAIKDKVSAKTYRSTRHQDLDELIRSLNRSLAGWANYFRHGVSKAVFSAVDSHAWLRLMRWIRRKYEGKHRLGMKELRNRFCDKGWRFAWNGVVFTGASSVAVTRYRYRGSNIPTPWTPAPAAPHHRQLTSGKGTWSAGCAERPHAGCGQAARGNDRRKRRHRARGPTSPRGSPTSGTRAARRRGRSPAEELQLFLDYADDQVDRAVRAKRKGALAAYRDATLVQGHLRLGAQEDRVGAARCGGLGPQPGGAAVRPVRDAARPLRQGQAGPAAAAPQRRLGDGVGGGGGGRLRGERPPEVRLRRPPGAVADRARRPSPAAGDQRPVRGLPGLPSACQRRWSSTACGMPMSRT